MHRAGSGNAHHARGTRAAGGSGAQGSRAMPQEKPVAGRGRIDWEAVPANPELPGRGCGQAVFTHRKGSVAALGDLPSALNSG
jgi:hypothetical protein